MTERVVFDTNVALAALLWRGKPYQAVLLARGGVVQAFYTDAMLAELSRKLREKFRFDENHIRAVMYQYREYAQRLETTPHLAGATRDPDDDKFVECAVAAQAQWLVSEDQHLLTLRQYQDVQVVTAAQFLKQVGIA